MLIHNKKRVILRSLVFAFGVVFACGHPSAQNSSLQPPAENTQIAIWPGNAPDFRPTAEPETLTTADAKEFVAGKPWVYVSNVSRPTITVYSPKERNTGAAVVVFPG